MNNRERWIISGILGIIAVTVMADLITDSMEGVDNSHILLEGLIAGAALFGMFFVFRGSFRLKHRLEDEIREFSDYKRQAEVWRAESRKYVDGLSRAIDAQLTKWNLTSAEKEVAFLLLKGFSLKEIADIRGTSEKTVRVQSMAVYAKAELSGRSELSAFFLEDLLVPPASQDGPSLS